MDCSSDEHGGHQVLQRCWRPSCSFAGGSCFHPCRKRSWFPLLAAVAPWRATKYRLELHWIDILLSYTHHPLLRPNTWRSCHMPLISCTVWKEKNKSIVKYNMKMPRQPLPYSTLTLLYTIPHTQKHTSRSLLSKPRLSACQTDSHNLCPAADSSRI